MISRQAYFMDDHSPYPNKSILLYDNEKRETHHLVFKKGIKLPAADIGENHYSQDPSTYNLIFESRIPEERLLKWDALPNSVLLPLVNKRCLAVLQDLCPGDFQYFPAVIRNENNKIEPFENHDYVLVNVAVNVPGVNEALEPIKLNEYGNIGNLKEVTLDDAFMEGHHLARLTLYRPVIIASSKLVEIFQKEKIKGFRFVHKYAT